MLIMSSVKRCVISRAYYTTRVASEIDTREKLYTIYFYREKLINVIWTLLPLCRHPAL